MLRVAVAVFALVAFAQAGFVQGVTGTNTQMTDVSGWITVSREGEFIQFYLYLENLVCDRGNVAQNQITNMHVHTGAPGNNGGVAVAFYDPAVELEVTQQGVDDNCTIVVRMEEDYINTQGNGPAFLAALGSVSFPNPLNFYVNVHTVRNGGGEIRFDLVGFNFSNEVAIFNIVNDAWPYSLGNPSVVSFTGTCMSGDQAFVIDAAEDCTTADASGAMPVRCDEIHFGRLVLSPPSREFRLCILPVGFDAAIPLNGNVGQTLPSCEGREVFQGERVDVSSAMVTADSVSTVKSCIVDSGSVFETGFVTTGSIAMSPDDPFTVCCAGRGNYNSMTTTCTTGCTSSSVLDYAIDGSGMNPNKCYFRCFMGLPSQ